MVSAAAAVGARSAAARVRRSARLREPVLGKSLTLTRREPRIRRKSVQKGLEFSQICYVLRT